MSHIHNVKKRQLVILHRHNYKNWLNSRLDYKIIFDESFNIKLHYKTVVSPLKSNLSV